MLSSIFHFHVPKTAGTTLRLVAEDNLDSADWQHSIADRELAFLLIGRARALRLDRHSFLSGHFPLGFRDMLKPPVTTICSIRDPVDLIVSYVFYQQAVGVIPADLDIDDFLASEAADAVVNLQSRFIADMAFPQFPADDAPFRRPASPAGRRETMARFAGEAIHRAAMANAATIDLVVDTADLNGGMAALCASLGWSMPPNLPLRNAGTYRRGEVTERTRRTIEAMCEVDRQIYRHLQPKAAARRSPPAKAARLCDAARPFTIDAADAWDGTGWHLREFVEEWGWARWSTETATWRTNLLLRTGGRYTLGLLLLDCITPNCLAGLSLQLGGIVLTLSFTREGAVWRGHADVPDLAADLLLSEITLRVPGARRPCDMGPGEDNRRLGVRVKCLVVAHTGQAGAAA